MTTLVPADETPVLLAVLVACAAGALWAEQRFDAVRKITGFMAALLAGMLLSNTRAIPASAPAIDLVWEWVVPLALPLLLLRANLVRIFRETGPTLGAFLVGAVGSAIGGLLAFRLVPLGPESWKATAVFVGTYTGGSINFLAVAKATELSPDLASAAVAADNLVMTVYFFVLIAAARSTRLRRWFAHGRPDVAVAGGEDARAAKPAVAQATPRPPATASDLAVALALAFVFFAAGTLAARAAEVPHLSVLFITALAVIAATAFPRRLEALGGAEELGVFLMHVFAVALGAAADIPTIVREGPLLFAMAALIISVHMVFLFVGCRTLRLPLPETIVASNANIGGPTTASAFAVAVRWERLVLPGVLAGVLGYVIANYVALAVGWAVH